jgi:sugar phosphate isomerase/epimerase
MSGNWFFGAAAWPFRHQPPYQDAIRRIARIGCRGFELLAWTPETLDEYYTPETIREIRAIAAGEGVALTAFTFTLRASMDASATHCTFDVAALERGMRTAAALGSPVFTSVSPYPFGQPVGRMMDRPVAQEWRAPVQKHWDWQADYAQFVQTLQHGCRLAAELGMKVAIEPHPYRWVASAQSMLRLIEHVGADNLGINLDPSHMFPVGELPHYAVHMLEGRVFGTHFSDNDGATNAHWRPGKGKIDWSALLAALDGVGYDGPITIELEDVPGTAHRTTMPEASAEFDVEMRKSMRYLREAAEEVGLAIG